MFLAGAPAVVVALLCTVQDDSTTAGTNTIPRDKHYTGRDTLQSQFALHSYLRKGSKSPLRF